MNKILPTLLLLLVLCAPALGADIAPAKAQMIRQLMDMTGAHNMSLQFAKVMNQQVAQVLKATQPDVPERALEVVENEINRMMEQEAPALLNRLAPIYDRQFSETELQQLIAFYQTDLGKKTITVMPTIMRESLAAGQAWGQEMAPKLMTRLEARFKQEKIELSLER